MKKLEPIDLISGKTYWYCNVRLSNTGKTLKVNQKPIELKIKVNNGFISLYYPSGDEYYHWGMWYHTDLRLDKPGENRAFDDSYFADYLFETEKDAKEGYNLLLGNIIDEIQEMANKRIESLKKKLL